MWVLVPNPLPEPSSSSFPACCVAAAGSCWELLVAGWASSVGWADGEDRAHCEPYARRAFEGLYGVGRRVIVKRKALDLKYKQIPGLNYFSHLPHLLPFSRLPL